MVLIGFRSRLFPRSVRSPGPCFPDLVVPSKVRLPLHSGLPKRASISRFHGFTRSHGLILCLSRPLTSDVHSSIPWLFNPGPGTLRYGCHAISQLYFARPTMITDFLIQPIDRNSCHNTGFNFSKTSLMGFELSTCRLVG